jgi:PII-like signaling protein
MKGVHLRIYTYENRKHQGLLVYEWLLERARKLDIHGGSAFRAIAGFGRHGKMHEQHFFELAGEIPILVEFIVTEEQADRLLELVRAEKLHLFYARLATEFGETDL